MSDLGQTRDWKQRCKEAEARVGQLEAEISRLTTPGVQDRTVHASYRDMEIVRYDRAGKWYLEPTIPGLKRQQVGIKRAVASAQWGIEFADGAWYAGRQGGATFDRLMRESHDG